MALVRPGRWRSMALALPRALATLSAPAFSAGADEPILGKWFGSAGPETDRIELGFEFKRD